MAVRYLFKNFCLEPTRHRLLKDGDDVTPGPKVFKLLRILLEDAPETVSKEKLLSSLWPGVDPASLENPLNQLIHVLRNTLDKQNRRRFVLTRPTFGYAFVADVEKEDSDALPPPRLAPTSSAAMPRVLSLSTKRTNPQWADFGDYSVPPAPWTLRCRLSTESAYFRFGFKLLGKAARLFGSGSIQSDDPNLVVHVARNYWDRPGITKRDLFLAAYVNGRRLDVDRKVCRSAKQVTVTLEFTIDRGHQARLLVDGSSYFSQIVPSVICHRVAILAWGDQDEYRVDVTELALKTVGRS